GLLMGKADRDRNDAGMRQAGMAGRRRRSGQGSVPDHFKRLQMRAQRFELCLRQRLKQLVGWPLVRRHETAFPKSSVVPTIHVKGQTAPVVCSRNKKWMLIRCRKGQKRSQCGTP